MERVVGTCSICGGEVTLPDIWYGVRPPKPTCQRCGAQAKSRGPVIPMEPRHDDNWHEDMGAFLRKFGHWF